MSGFGFIAREGVHRRAVLCSEQCNRYAFACDPALFFPQATGRLGKEGRYFLALWATNFALLACELCIDILGISAPTASLAPFVAVVTAIFYTLNPTVGVFYFLYIQHVVGKRTKRWFLLLLVTPVLFVAVTSVINIHTK